MQIHLKVCDAQIAMESGFTLLMLWVVVRWSFVQGLQIRLLAMLHGAFLWLDVVMGLFAVFHILMTFGNDEFSLGLAPLHALITGCLCATLFAMATRVSSGHSVKPP